MNAAKQTLPEDAAHVLIVDDDDRIRNLLKRYLTENGFRTSVAKNGEEQQEPLLPIRPYSISLNQSGIIDSLASQIFLANGSVLASNVTGDREECRN